MQIKGVQTPPPLIFEAVKLHSRKGACIPARLLVTMLWTCTDLLDLLLEGSCQLLSHLLDVRLDCLLHISCNNFMELVSTNLGAETVVWMPPIYQYVALSSACFCESMRFPDSLRRYGYGGLLCWDSTTKLSPNALDDTSMEHLASQAPPKICKSARSLRGSVDFRMGLSHIGSDKTQSAHTKNRRGPHIKI